MKLQDFTYLLKQPCEITTEQTSAIEDILNHYPYFQAARVLYLKGLKKQSSYKYNNTLKTTAAYTTNRTVLFDFITQDTLDIVKKEAKEQAVIQESEVVNLEVIETENQITVAKPVLESLQIGQPLEFNKAEKHSFNEWLQLTSYKPIKRHNKPVLESEKVEEKEIATEKIATKNLDLINQFLATKPKIKPDRSSVKTDISLGSVLENETLMTETLARVYLEQKKYEKAIKAFKILSLKYPEKSGFFADRIKAVKFLQKNNS